MQVFGEQLSGTTAALSAEGGAERIKALTLMLISLILLIVGIFYIVNGDETMSKIASGWVGAVIGYWLS